MKSKRYTTEQKIRILRDAERADISIVDVCRQNGYIESFHARFREECLNREQLWTLTEARVVIGDWRWKYNYIRPHRSLGNISPIKFAQQIAETQEATEQGSGSTRPMASFRQNLDFLYNLNHIKITSRLTNHMAQFG